MRRESTEIKFFLENLISGWKQNDETEFFPQNLVSFYHNSTGCAVRALCRRLIANVNQDGK